MLPYMEQDNIYRQSANGATVLNPPNVAIKTLVCPARGRQMNSTAGANSPGWNGPFTCYKMNWVSFDNRSNADVNRLNMSTITSNRGTAQTVYVGEGFLDTRDYRRNHGSNWEEVIYSGGYGGTGRGTTVIMKDDQSGQGDKWGSPHASGALFVFCDGSVRVVPFTMNGSAVFFAALRWNSTNPAQLN
jgi:hypothetical protein